MVEIIKSDIFKAPVEIIIHQSNCFNTMGSGIAQQIKKLFPRAYEADCMTKCGDYYKMGQFSFCSPNVDQDKWIINLYAQYRYGSDGAKKKYTDYGYFRLGLSRIHSWIVKMGLDNLTIGIPFKIGSDRAGGDWRIIEGIIREVFEDTKIKVLICQR